MTDKEVKHLSRAELLEILIAQMKENDVLIKANEALVKENKQLTAANESLNTTLKRIDSLVTDLTGESFRQAITDTPEELQSINEEAEAAYKRAIRQAEEVAMQIMQEAQQDKENDMSAESSYWIEAADVLSTDYRYMYRAPLREEHVADELPAETDGADVSVPEAVKAEGNVEDAVNELMELTRKSVMSDSGFDAAMAEAAAALDAFNGMRVSDDTEYTANEETVAEEEDAAPDELPEQEITDDSVAEEISETPEDDEETEADDTAETPVTEKESIAETVEDAVLPDDPLLSEEDTDEAEEDPEDCEEDSAADGIDHDDTEEVLTAETGVSDAGDAETADEKKKMTIDQISRIEDIYDYFFNI